MVVWAPLGCLAICVSASPQQVVLAVPGLVPVSVPVQGSLSPTVEVPLAQTGTWNSMSGLTDAICFLQVPVSVAEAGVTPVDEVRMANGEYYEFHGTQVPQSAGVIAAWRRFQDNPVEEAPRRATRAVLGEASLTAPLGGEEAELAGEPEGDRPGSPRERTGAGRLPLPRGEGLLDEKEAGTSTLGRSA